MDPQPRNLAQLATALESAWLNISVNTFRNITDSLPARLAAVRSAKVPIVNTFCFLLIIDINPNEIEDESIVWSAHPSEHLSPTQIYLEGDSINTGLIIYIGGSKTEKGVGADLFVMTDLNISHRCSTRLSLRNTVFQSELLALLKAVEHAVALRTQQLTILVANQDSIQSAAKPKSHNTITLNNFRLLHSHSHIRVSWIRGRVGYLGNEDADRLAKEASETEKFSETTHQLSNSFNKSILRQKMMATLQMMEILGNSLITSFLKLACNQSTEHETNFCFSQDMGLSHRITVESMRNFPVDQTLILFL
ncbi:hypothetical protein AVEN_225741-1 [Araneus ventricosus]|uniref:RNase H type-1 domain-containing protein n=1 Tax=Araneus ventricosus TaxID=182803 RepID=A0A4Y2FUP2_ARAVE|nr:hypothetical protein AVEN_225741-1 [Araneus ventricosus]